jgi:calcineurin-like phosphoesterase family protein
MDSVVTLDTWIISDTHFRHKNIIKYCNRPMSHDNLMADNWHNLVKEDDDVLHLGDLMVWWSSLEQTEAMMIANALPGRKRMLRGNHDKLTDEEFLVLTGFEVIPEFTQTFGQTKVRFSHYPQREGNWHLNVHGHIHNNHDPDIIPYRNINVSVEVMDYKPVRLREILNGKL